MTYTPTGAALGKKEVTKESVTFSGVDHLASVEAARAGGLPPPPGRDPSKTGIDPFKAAFLNRAKGA